MGKRAAILTLRFCLPLRPNGPGHGSPGQSEERATPWVHPRSGPSPERARQRLSRTDSAEAKPHLFPGLRSPEAPFDLGYLFPARQALDESKASSRKSGRECPRSFDDHTNRFSSLATWLVVLASCDVDWANCHSGLANRDVRWESRHVDLANCHIDWASRVLRLANRSMRLASRGIHLPSERATSP